ncbi:MAG: aminoacyl-histidine dipeptidase [Flavobacteriaceae bacterium]
MTSALSTIAPREIWTHFEALNAIPRGSKKEAAVIEFIQNFGAELGLETQTDGVGNVLIKKPATGGMNHRKTIVMQAHLDMVHQKNSEVDFDFDTQGIQMYVDGDWVKAKGTTLGADNGLGVAAIMGVLASDTIKHPAIEALFTIDEETGMTGALALEGDWLTGEILLNLDTEEDDELGVGCAGGIDVTFKASYKPLEVTSGQACRISVSGLKGGHSGMDIHLGLGNANKIMNRLLWSVKNVVDLVEIKGGSLRNAIPRESFAVVLVQDDQMPAFNAAIEDTMDEIRTEYGSLEPDLTMDCQATDAPKQLVPRAAFESILCGIQATLNGVYCMSPDIEGLVEASNNLSKVRVENGLIQWECLTRSSVESTKWDLVRQLQAVGHLADCEVDHAGDYPGWAPNMDSAILKLMRQIYQEQFQTEPRVAACHAGLECGIIGKHYPKMDMISFGPNIRGAHSPDERASISSAQKFWGYLCETLARIPEKI